MRQILSACLIALVVAGVIVASPALGAPRTGQGEVTASATVGEPVNVNTAGVKELMTLRGIGRKVAERIVSYREAHGPFKALDDLRRVQGVGASLLERNRQRIVLK